MVQIVRTKKFDVRKFRTAPKKVGALWGATRLGVFVTWGDPPFGFTLSASSTERGKLSIKYYKQPENTKNKRRCGCPPFGSTLSASSAE